MPLYLVQHGLSAAREVDPDRGLTEQGRQEVQRIAEVARGYRVRVAAIVHSGKTRALQTAEILARNLDPPGGVHGQKGLDPLGDVTAAAPSLTAEDDLMVVGHLPFLSRLAALLVTGDQEREIFAFQNGGIVCLDRKGEAGSWVITWTLMPCIGG